MVGWWQGLHDAVNPTWLGVIDAIQSRHVGWDVLDDMLGVQCRVRRNDKSGIGTFMARASFENKVQSTAGCKFMGVEYPKRACSLLAGE